jgi:hypothetical protein
LVIHLTASQSIVDLIICVYGYHSIGGYFSINQCDLGNLYLKMLVVLIDYYGEIVHALISN